VILLMAAISIGGEGPDAGKSDAYGNLQPVLTKPTNWEIVRHQYDQMAKYVIAVRVDTAQTDSILRRFTRSGEILSAGRPAGLSFSGSPAV
jgi:hypothetical protein